MKKIFCVMVAVVFCFGAVLVSASAETPIYNYNGVDLPYPPLELENTDYKYFLIFEESNGGYTLVASNVSLILNNYGSQGQAIYLVDKSLYTLYVLNDGQWESFGGGNVDLGFDKFLTFPDSLVWTSHTIIYTKDSSKNIVGDTNFVFPPPIPKPPLHEEINGVTGEAVNGLANDTFDALGVLVPIGIGIMALFVGVALIPRVIFKFL